MILDKIGQEIKPGSIIAYGHALGRCAGIRIGKVLAVGAASKPKWHGDSIYRITVMGISDDWNHEKACLCDRKGTLQYPSRIVVLDPEKVPGKYRELLDPIEIL